MLWEIYLTSSSDRLGCRRPAATGGGGWVAAVDVGWSSAVCGSTGCTLVRTWVFMSDHSLTKRIYIVVVDSFLMDVLSTESGSSFLSYGRPRAEDSTDAMVKVRRGSGAWSFFATRRYLNLYHDCSCTWVL